jgi:hypothetical protein
MYSEVQLGQDIIVIVSHDDRLLRTNGANELPAKVTRVNGPLDCNAQIFTDGLGLEWRTNIKHQSEANSGDNCFRYLGEPLSLRAGDPRSTLGNSDTV